MNDVNVIAKPSRLMIAYLYICVLLPDYRTPNESAIVLNRSTTVAADFSYLYKLDQWGLRLVVTNGLT